VEVATSFLSRLERFPQVGSTNDVVRAWLADGTPEVCLAIADEQTAGRGRNGRTWSAPSGAGLLLSLGFRPTWVPPDRVWQLAATASLAMAEAAEDEVGLAVGDIGLKWPNDLVVTGLDGVRKLAGVLGETDGLGSADPRVIVGIGVNTDWRAAAFPPDLASSMTSLRAAAGDHAVSNDRLVDAFAARLDERIGALRAGRFDATAWSERQVTTGRDVDLVLPDGATDRVLARGVDPVSGALLVDDLSGIGRPRAVVVGEIRHVRLAAE
jgi:BirA family transcriptional regulator, biotin operon repressor / biotin---[acetyl-CoA-carboxylase] ligase